MKNVEAGYHYVISYCNKNKKILIKKIVENKQRILEVVKYVIKNGKLS